MIRGKQKRSNFGRKQGWEPGRAHLESPHSPIHLEGVGEYQNRGHRGSTDTSPILIFHLQPLERKVARLLTGDLKLNIPSLYKKKTFLLVYILLAPHHPTEILMEISTQAQALSGIHLLALTSYP